jgi:hypothetical protein
MAIFLGVWRGGGWVRDWRGSRAAEGWPGVILDHPPFGATGPSRPEGGPAGGWGLGPFGVCNYDGPETIRARKYATGTHVLLQEIGVETGATPGEVVWSRNKTRLYRYRSPGESATGGARRRGVRCRCSWSTG